MAHLVRFLAAASLLASAQGVLGATSDDPLRQAIDRGKTLYSFDRAAWITSDDAVARLPPKRLAESGGWIVTPSGSGLHVDYFGKGAAADRVIYAADVQGETLANAIAYPISGEPELKSLALQMAKALRAARIEVSRHSDWKPCANARFNTIVLPPQKDGSVPVYFLTPQVENDTFPFGGHYEVDIAAVGRTVNARPFTRSCLAVSKPAAIGGAASAALFVTHTLDPKPTEIHVFEQYYVGIPVYVGTGPKTVWKVEGGSIIDVSAMLAR